MEQVLRELLAYNDDANRRFIETIRQAKPSSERVAVIFSHILNAHTIWNTRIGGVSPEGGVWTVHPVDAWEERNRANFQRTREILDSDSLVRVVAYRDSRGNPYENQVGEILLHVFNHSTYHRGQLAILLGQESKTPPVTDFIVYLRDAK